MSCSRPSTWSAAIGSADPAKLILEKNLYGLDIDAGGAADGLCLMMKGRADDRRLFERGVKLNVMALVDSAGFDAEGLAKGVKLGDYGLKPGDLTELKRLFEHATTFGSLIQVPEGLAEKLPALKQLSEATSQDLFVSEALKRWGRWCGRLSCWRHSTMRWWRIRRIWAASSCSYVLQRSAPKGLSGRFLRLFEKQGNVASNQELEGRFHANPRFTISNTDFEKIPGRPITYWVSMRIFKLFSRLRPLSEVGHACSGLQAGNNDLYLRQWYEVSILTAALWTEKLDCEAPVHWLPHRKGGAFRRWYGNMDFVLDWKHDGREIKANPSARPQNTDYWFKPAVSWSHTSISLFSARYAPAGSTFNVEGPSFFSEDATFATGLMCSAPVFYLMQLMNPTLHFLVGSVSKVPVPIVEKTVKTTAHNIAEKAIALTKFDWDSYERSWDFQSLPILNASLNPPPPSNPATPPGSLRTAKPSPK
jgi:hypothetical protein